MTETVEPQYELTINAGEPFEIKTMDEFDIEGGDGDCELILQVNGEQVISFRCSLEEGMECLETLQDYGLAQ